LKGQNIYQKPSFIDASNHDYIHFKNIQLEKNGKGENLNKKTEGVLRVLK